MGWDGILSWNNWALQLVQFEYWPYNAYYQAGFHLPGQFFMIYRIVLTLGFFISAYVWITFISITNYELDRR